LPAFAGGYAVLILSNDMLTWPATASAMAWGLPLYGTCCIFVPDRLLKSSPARCADVPLPDVE